MQSQGQGRKNTQATVHALTRGGNGDKEERGWLPSTQLRLGFPLDSRTQLNNPKLREGEGGASHPELPLLQRVPLTQQGPLSSEAPGAHVPLPNPSQLESGVDTGSRKPGPLPHGAPDAEVQFGAQSSLRDLAEARQQPRPQVCCAPSAASQTPP